MFRRFLSPLVCFISVAAFTGLSHATNVREFVLDNGLKILLLENHKSPAVTLQVWYRGTFVVFQQ